jgi:hypothetical protein
MGEMNRFVEAAVVTALFAVSVLCMNYSSDRGCAKTSAAVIDRGPSHVIAN